MQAMSVLLTLIIVSHKNRASLTADLALILIYKVRTYSYNNYSTSYPFTIIIGQPGSFFIFPFTLFRA